MLDYFLDALPSTSDHGFPCGHRLQVYATQALVPAGQSKKIRASHGFGNLAPTLTSKEAGPVGNAKFTGQPLQARAFRAIANNFAGEIWATGGQCSKRTQQ